MKAVQTIELSDDERLVLSKVLELIDEISDATDISMDRVFDYFVETSDLTENEHYTVKALHSIEEMREMQ